jgi:RHS repeat-associated protein
MLRDTVYQSGTIVTNHKIYRNITVTGTATVAAGSKVKLNASENILITPTFHPGQDADFYAHVLGEDEGTFMYDATGNLVADQDRGMRISWTPNGKVREVRSKIDSVVISFRYNPQGHRIAKIVTTPDTTYTFRYVSDVRGRVMAIYRDTTARNHFIYGKSRIGVYNGKMRQGKQMLGHKQYELANHLGNVLTVITDNVAMKDTAWATVVSASDYYPFGLGMKERTVNDTTYRHGFNGQEKDSEIGEGIYTAEFWEYDSRLGRRWNPDPKPEVGVSEYACFANNPIALADMRGDKPTPKGKVSQWLHKNLPGIIAAPLSGLVDFAQGAGKLFAGIATLKKATIKQGLEDMGAGLLGSIGLREAVYEKWKGGVTGGLLPASLADDIEDVQGKVWDSTFIDHPEKNGMHAWHAGSNAVLTQKLGPLGAVITFLGGLFHESPFDKKSFHDEQKAQGTVNHIIDSSTDIVANTFGIIVGLLLPKKWAATVSIKLGNHIPGPGDPDPNGTGAAAHNYKGNPFDAWGQYPKIKP